MENIDLSDNVKLEESCVIVDDNLLYEVARRNRKLRSYKVFSLSLSHRNCVIVYVLCVYAPSTHVDWRLWVSVCVGNVFGAMHLCSM